MPINKTIDGIKVVIDADDKLDAALKKSERSVIKTSRVVDRETKKMGNSFSRLGGVMKSSLKAGAAGAALAIVPLSLHFKNAARDAQEMEDKFDAVFKNTSDDVREWSKLLASEINRSEYAIREFASGFQDLFVPLGFTREEAAKLSKQLTELAIDVSSFSNIAESQVIDNFKAALVGSSEAVMKYGVIAKEANVQQEALNKGWIKNKKELTEQMKVLARINLILDGTSDAHGNAADTAESQANQEKALAAQIEALSIKLGTELEPITLRVTQALISMAEAANEFFGLGAEPERMGFLGVLDKGLADKSARIDAINKQIDYLSHRRVGFASAPMSDEDRDAAINALVDEREVLERLKSSYESAIESSNKRAQAEKDAAAARAKAIKDAADAEARDAIDLSGLKKMDAEIDKVRQKNALAQMDEFQRITAQAEAEIELFRKMFEEKKGFEDAFERYKIERMEQAYKEADELFIKNQKELSKMKQEQIDEDERMIDQFSWAWSMAFSNAFEDAILAGEKLGDVLDNLLKQLAMMIIRQQILNPIAKKVGGLFAGIFPFADGGIMGSRGPIPMRSYASGGIARTPQLAEFGEGSQNEAFVPLPDGNRIPVRMEGGGNGQVNQTEINQTLVFEQPAADTVAAMILAVTPIVKAEAANAVRQAISGVKI